ncbi:MAG TPA: butyrate kinase [Firmicutes bacterium]|uniref:Probable butyrate kinase n=1 Tax=Candidatus Fermentithermobacillus carboniphilus TaxID=3085328 RepID=A0AAT9LCV8_9FIRM|nr:MAG: butyrate kinase [Candidatus Fermentithermobacillus carboniphilus]HHW17939.1 butyrate kinase [Candidatus Fermentithermobacillaceae bacterium]
MAQYKILVINPGSTTTKLAIFSEEGLVVGESLDHTGEEWATRFKTVDQLPFRVAAVEEFLKRNSVEPRNLSCVVARGGLLRPVKSGTYIVNEEMVKDLRQEVGGSHASNLGGLLASHVASLGGIPAYVVDPVSVDEYSAVARLSGIPDLPRKSLLHALNMKASARKAAVELGKPLGELFLVIAHLGSGFSVSPCYKGRLTDANNSNEEGPFTVERAGTLPSLYLKELYDNIQDPKKLKTILVSESGMYGYLGTKDARAVEMAARTERKADLVYRAMAYQVAKEICAMAATYPESPDAVVITGGLARSSVFTGLIRERTGFLGPHLVYPGEDEMGALAEGALRVLKKEEAARVYPEKEVFEV